MSQAITFDTHRFIKRMTGTGMSEQTAEALADEHIQLLEGNLATRQQLDATNQQLDAHRNETKLEFAKIDARIVEIESKLTTRMAEIESGLLRWMVGLFIAQGGVVVSLVKLL